MAKRKRRAKRGRPQQAQAKRRTTTRQGRRTGLDPVDEGTPQLLRKRKRATGSQALCHEEPLAVLFGRGLITTDQYNAGRDIAELLGLIERDRFGSVWQRILSGVSAAPVSVGPSPQALWAQRVLRRLEVAIGPTAELVIGVCAGRWWVFNPGVIAAGLERVASCWSGNSIAGRKHSEMIYSTRENNQYQGLA